MRRVAAAIVCLGWVVGGGLTSSPVPLSESREGGSGDKVAYLMATQTPLPAATEAVGNGLTAEQKLRAERLISLFENDTIEIQYGYSEELGDGRGITAGKIGFTTADGDLLEVVTLYTEKVPHNPLAHYLPQLRELAKVKADDAKGLAGFHLAWAKAARDPVFWAIQDEVADRVYYEPAMRIAGELGLKTALAKTAIYDAIIQHGDGDDPDGLPALLEQTRINVRGTPKNGIGEIRWLYEFLKVRRRDLVYASDPDTREVWKQSVGRCDALTGLVQSGNYELVGPITINIFGRDETVP